MPITIQNARGWDALRQRFSIVGRHRLQLDEVIVPVVIMDDITEQTDTVGQLATAFALAPAVAAKKSSVVFFNGVTSETGYLFNITRIRVSSTGTIGYTFGFTTVAPLSPIAASTVDQTWNDVGQTGTPPGNLFTDDGAFAGPVLYNYRSIPTDPFDYVCNLIIPFQNALVVTNENTNKSSHVSIEYTVLPLTL